MTEFISLILVAEVWKKFGHCRGVMPFLCVGHLCIVGERCILTALRVASLRACCPARKTTGKAATSE
jgi:hypothetical protein